MKTVFALNLEEIMFSALDIIEITYRISAPNLNLNNFDTFDNKIN